MGAALLRQLLQLLHCVLPQSGCWFQHLQAKCGIGCVMAFGDWMVLWGQEDVLYHTW